MIIPASWRARVRRAWPVAQYIIGLGLAALVFDQLADQKSVLAGVSIALSRLYRGWVLLGMAAVVCAGGGAHGLTLR